MSSEVCPALAQLSRRTGIWDAQIMLRTSDSPRQSAFLTVPGRFAHNYPYLAHNRIQTDKSGLAIVRLKKPVPWHSRWEQSKPELSENIFKNASQFDVFTPSDHISSIESVAYKIWKANLRRRKLSKIELFSLKNRAIPEFQATFGLVLPPFSAFHFLYNQQSYLSA